MKFKRFIYIGFILGGGLCGCYNARQQPAGLFIGQLRSPSSDQVRKWAGLSERTQLTMFTNIPPDVPYGYGEEINFGKFTWLWAYEDRKGSNIDCFVIAVYEPGEFYPSKRSEFNNDFKQINKHPKPRDKEGQALSRELGPAMLSGQKSYGFLFGLWPARFAFRPKFDLLAYEVVEPVPDDNRHPPADMTEMPTNYFSTFFTNVDSFLTSQ
jgi:hypothetical protein